MRRLLDQLDGFWFDHAFCSSSGPEIQRLAKIEPGADWRRPDKSPVGSCHLYLCRPCGAASKAQISGIIAALHAILIRRVFEDD